MGYVSSRPVAPWAALALAAFLAPGLGAQELASNATLLGKLKQHPKFSDVWGYVAPDGREFALSCANDGLAVVDCTDPTDPVEVAYISGPGCTWRDVKTYQGRAYVGSECFAGVQVVDLTDPYEAELVNTFGTSDFNSSHNVAIDVDTGMLYAAGANGGMYVYDLSVDPVDPPMVALYSESSGADSGGGDGGGGDHGSGAFYVHDLWVQDGLAHLCELNSGEYRIVDVANLPDMPTVSVTGTFTAFTHSVSVNEENTVAVVMDEKIGVRNCAIFDISDPSSPVFASSIDLGNQDVPHNPYIDGDVLHAAWYKDGYRAYDISDPSNPVELGFYDTYPIDGVPSFDGAWGAFPYTDSGFVYVNDMTFGLHVIKLGTVDPDPTGKPALGGVWPTSVDALTVPRRTVVLDGAGFTDATSVQVGDATLAAGEFTVMDDRTITFPMPLVDDLGAQDVVVTNAQGASSAATLLVEQVPEPLLDVPAAAAVGEAVEIAVASAPADTHYLIWSPSDVPSSVPGVVSLGIGDGLTSLFILPPELTNGAGLTTHTFTPSGVIAGMDIHWQAASLDLQLTTPVPVTPVMTLAVD